MAQYRGIFILMLLELQNKDISSSIYNWISIFLRLYKSDPCKILHIFFTKYLKKTFLRCYKTILFIVFLCVCVCVYVYYGAIKCPNVKNVVCPQFYFLCYMK